MAQGHKTNTVDLRAKLKGGQARSQQWIYWVVGGVAVLAIVAVAVLALPSFMPKRQPDLGSIPTAAEQEGDQKGAGALPAMTKDDKQIILDAAANDGATGTDGSNVSVRYDKDTQHAVISVPTGSGKTFRVKTYRMSKQGDGSWALQ